MPTSLQPPPPSRMPLSRPTHSISSSTTSPASPWQRPSTTPSTSSITSSTSAPTSLTPSVTKPSSTGSSRASEILAILLQNRPANQKRLGQINGVDALLQAIAMYKSKDPKTDEEEMLENLFDCLCCIIMPMENKERFVKAQGVELMMIIMKQKKLAYSSAVLSS